MSLKASSSISDRKIEKSTHPCLIPFVLANVSETSIPDVHDHSGMQTFYHGCELFRASIFPHCVWGDVA